MVYLKGCTVHVLTYQIKKLEEPMFKEGDVIVNEHGNKATILAVCGKVFSRSLSGDQNQNQHYGWMSFDTAEENGWKLYELKDTVTLTTEDGDKVEISKKSLESLKKL